MQGHLNAPEGRCHCAVSRLRMVTCLILALLFACAKSYTEYMTFVFSLEFVLECVTATALFLGMFCLLDWVADGNAFLPGFMRRIVHWGQSPSGTLAETLRVAVLLLACWLPYLLWMYPGNLSNDTTGQLSMFYTIMGHGDYWMTAQHPVFDTLVFGAITYPFYAAGHFRVGVFVCILLQEIATAISMGFVFARCRGRWHLSEGLYGACLMLVALCPVYPLIACSLSKDTFFSWVYILWLVLTLDCVLDGDGSVWRCVAMTGLGALMCLTKKFGFYVVALSAAVMAVALAGRVVQGKRKQIFGAFVCVFCVALLTNFVAVPAINRTTHASPSLSADVLIVPIQQLAMTYSKYPEEFQGNSLETLQTYVNTEAIDGGRWDPTIADSIKVNRDDSLHVKSFMELWLKTGLRHPNSYVDGWAALEAPLFTYGGIVPLYDSVWHTWARADVIPDQLFEKGKPFARATVSIESWYQWLSEVPILDVFLMQAFYVLLLPMYLLSVLLSKEGRGLRSAFMPVLVSFLGLLVSPLVTPNEETTRYLM